MEKQLIIYLLWLVPAAVYFIFRILKMKHLALLMKSGRYSRHAYYSAAALSGFFYAQFPVSYTPALLIGAFGVLVVINSLFFAALMINNAFDSDIDAINKKPNTSEYADRGSHMSLASAAMLYSAVLSAFMSMRALAAALAVAAVSYAYSAPPLRLKRIFPVNTMTIALCTILAYLLGFYASPESALKKPPSEMLLFLFAGLSLAFNVKDINDISGDKKHGVMTLMTLLGKKNGAAAAAFCAFAGYMVFGLWHPVPAALLLSAAAGGLTAAAVLMSKEKLNEIIVFIILAFYAAAFYLVYAG